ncbi:MAG TPA: glycosyltransferase family 4 protein [Geminicoccaceae bacterium]|nr:glycosyltransferase family 4 protein [Geminicoccaceae bacterium]
MAPTFHGPQRVLMTADPIGGVWTYALELADGLGRAGVATVLATMGRELAPAQRARAEAVPGLVLEESRLKLEWMPDAGDDVARAGDWLLGLERRHAPDLVHVNGYAHAALPWRAPCIAVAHSCVWSWWRAVKGGPLPPEWYGYARRVAEGLHAAQLVVAPTAAFLDTIQTLYGALPRARVIHNGRSAAAFRPAAVKEEIVFSAGRVWDEAKNVGALDAVAADLGWPVIVAGDWQPPDGRGEPPANALCLSTLDPDQIAAWLARAAVFALPARYEPFGLAALEAGLSGCALVLGDIPTLRELWEDAAVFVPPDDHAALREALRELVRSPSRRAELGRAARARALELGAERMARGYLQAYADVLSRRPAVAGRVAAPLAAAALPPIISQVIAG